MKASELDILMIPGLGDSGPEHWQTRWAKRLSTSRKVHQDDWDNPDSQAWSTRVAEAANEATRPLVLVAHSIGIPALISAVPRLTADVRAALLVAPPDLDQEQVARGSLKSFGPYPRDPLPFPSIMIGSQNDPHCATSVAEDLAAAWGSLFIDAGEAGDISPESGYGPWPEGLLTFAKLLSRV